MSRRTLTLFLLSSLLFLLPLAAQQTANKPLGNADVVGLVQAGLDEDLIVAKIRQAPLVNFDVSTDELVRLNALKTPKAVITAMLDRMNQNSNGVGPTAQMPPQMQAVMGSLRVELITPDDKRAIEVKSAYASSTFIYVGMLNWLNVQEPKAAVRTATAQPTIRLFCDCDINKQVIAIARVEANAEDPSVKLKRDKLFASSGTRSLDPDWVITRQFNQVSPGVWDATLTKPLKKGEYALVDLVRSQMFDFGID